MKSFKTFSPKMSKIITVIVGPTPPPYGGVSVITNIIVNALKEHEQPLIHIQTRKPLDAGGQLRPNMILQDTITIMKLFYNLLKYRTCLVYIILCSQTRSGILRDCIKIAISKAFGAKVVIHLHTGAVFRKIVDSSATTKTLVRCVLPQADACIVLGQSLVSIFDGFISSRKVHVVPNGLDSTIIPDDTFQNIMMKRKCRHQEHPLHVIFLGNLIKSKGYLDLLRAIALCKRQNVKIKCTFAGAWVGTSQQIAEEICRREKLDLDDVQFPGVLMGNDKWSLLAQADVFVLPSYYPGEAQPISILEAMASGLPIISTATGCISDMVQNGINGYIVEPHDPETIAKKLCELAKDTEKCLKMGFESRRLFESNFTSEKMIERLLAIFQHILA